MATPGAEFATLGRKVPGKAGDDTEAELRTLEKEITGNRDGPISSLLTRVVKRVSSITLATGAAIAVCDQWGVTCSASVGDAPEVGSRLRPDSALTRECFESGQVVVCKDTESDFRVRRTTAQSLRLRSAVVVPLQNQGPVLGVIEVLSSRPSAFSPAHVAGLQRIANLLADILAPTLPQPAQPVIGSDVREDVLVGGAPASPQREQVAVASFPSAAPARKPKSNLSVFLVPAAGIVLLLLLWFLTGFGRRWTTQPSSRTLRPAEIQSRTATEHPNPTPEQQTLQSDNSARTDVSRLGLNPASRPASADSASDLRAEPIIPVQKKSPLAGNAIENGAAPIIRSAAPIVRPAVPAIVIQGVPPGTQIFVDNQLMASTNSAGQAGISTLPSGRHHLRLRVNGYRDYDQDVDVQGEKTSTITAKLDPLELPTFSEPAKSPALAVNAAMPAPVLLTRPNLPDFVWIGRLKPMTGGLRQSRSVLMAEGWLPEAGIGPSGSGRCRAGNSWAPSATR